MKIRIMACATGALYSLNAFAVPITVDDFYTPDSPTFTVNAPSGLLANDSSADGGLRVVSFTLPSQGNLTLTSDGAFTYTPDSGQSTNTVVTYTASDNSNTFSSANVTFDMVSTLPSANNDNYTPDSTSFSVNANNGWLANDTGGIGNLSAVSFQAPSQGSLNVATDGSFTYTPDPGQSTNEIITYTIRDTLSRLSSGEVTFDLQSTLPSAVNDFYTVLAGQNLIVDPLGLLSNDLLGIGTLSVVAFTQSADGLLNLTTNGSFTFAPNAGFTGMTSFNYFMRDELGRTSSALATIEVVGANSVPEASTIWLMLAGLIAAGRRLISRR